MNVTFYTGGDVTKTRALWEEVFTEETKEFTDYYFKQKAENNLTYVVEENGKIVSMIHLSPYMTNRSEEVCYMEGVATKKEYRRQGLMELLLRNSFQMMRQEGEAFTFLMPADPAIYEKFGFRTIYRKPKCILTAQLKEAICQQKSADFYITLGDYQIQKATKADDLVVSVFANKVLSRDYDLYIQRTKAYYEMQRAELLAQKGCLLIVRKEGVIYGLISITDEHEPVVQEALFKEEILEETDSFVITKEETESTIMVRILDVKEMFARVWSDKAFVMSLRITDERIMENSGIFMLHCGPMGGYLKAVSIQEEQVESGEHCVAECETTMEQLTDFLFGEKNAAECFHVYAKSREEEIHLSLDSLTRIKKIQINEIV